jgi:hypothetical protein
MFAVDFAYVLLYFQCFVFVQRKGSVDDSYGFNGKGDDGTDTKPSRVLHLRNVPDEIIEAEIVQLGLPFGQMTNMLLIRSKKQVGFFFKNSLQSVADILSYVIGYFEQ